MKLFDQYHDRYKCKGHTKENTFFRLVGLVLFVVVWSGLWMIPADSIFYGIFYGVVTTVLIDLVGGIGRRSAFLGNLLG